MTVDELIAKLQGFPGDWTVQVPETNLSGMQEATTVRESLFRPDTVEIDG